MGSGFCTTFFGKNFHSGRKEQPTGPLGHIIAKIRVGCRTDYKRGLDGVEQFGLCGCISNPGCNKFSLTPVTKGNTSNFRRNNLKFIYRSIKTTTQGFFDFFFFGLLELRSYLFFSLLFGTWHGQISKSNRLKGNRVIERKINRKA